MFLGTVSFRLRVQGSGLQDLCLLNLLRDLGKITSPPWVSISSSTAGGPDGIIPSNSKGTLCSHHKNSPCYRASSIPRLSSSVPPAARSRLRFILWLFYCSWPSHTTWWSGLLFLCLSQYQTRDTRVWIEFF